jgi:hypothetical protein
MLNKKYLSEEGEFKKEKVIKYQTGTKTVQTTRMKYSTVLAETLL